MSMIAMSCAALSPASSSRIWAWIVTSRAVEGSSASSSLGLHASAMAIMTRCRIPPENWCGYARRREAGSGIPTSAMAVTAIDLASARRTF